MARRDGAQKGLSQTEARAAKGAGSGARSGSALVNLYTEAALAANTHRSYRIDMNHFHAWGGKVPTTAGKVAQYLAEHAGVLAVATLQHRLIAIHRAHLEADKASPVMDSLVKQTMQGIRRTHGTKQRQVQALVKDDILELLLAADKQLPLKAARDRALILVGFAGAFRRSELVSILREDLTWFDHGVEVHIRRTKTQQEKGHTVFIPSAQSARCPVQALQAWLALAGIKQGPVFRPVSRYDRIVGEAGLTPQSVALVLKSVTWTARGHEASRQVAGHSLRAGYCTEAATVGVPTHVIMEQTGHTSSVTLAKYVRPVGRRRTPSLL